MARKTAVEIADRRLQVARLKRKGKSPDQIAAELSVQRHLVYEDLKLLREEWLTKAASEYDEMMAETLGELLAVRTEAVESFETSKEGGKAAGDPRFLDLVRKITVDVVQLLGLDDPVKFNARRGRGTESTTVKTDIVEIVVSDRNEIEQLRDEHGNISFAVYQKRLQQGHSGNTPSVAPGG